MALVDATFDHSGTALLIIDPQRDFHTNGSLAVEGADKDSARIAKMIRAHQDKISNVYITLDSHQPLHIAHAIFWKDQSGNHPNPFTVITEEDVLSGKWMASREDLVEVARQYVTKLKQSSKFSLCIWPPHCLIGTLGHTVVPEISNAVIDWSRNHKLPVNYIMKGQNPLTEMYSALKAEIEILEDPTTCLNTTLIAKLSMADRIIICGQALSHCVNFTTRDLIANLPEDRRSKIVILRDGSSPVPGFEDEGAAFLQDMKNMGVQIRTTEDVFS